MNIFIIFAAVSSVNFGMVFFILNINMNINLKKLFYVIDFINYNFFIIIITRFIIIIRTIGSIFNTIIIISIFLIIELHK
jgi:hypothetical protein